MTDIALDEKALDAAQKALYTAWSSGDYDEAGPMAAAAVTAYLEAAPSPSQVAGDVVEALREIADLEGQAGAYIEGNPNPAIRDYERQPLYTHPAPSGQAVAVKPLEWTRLERNGVHQEHWTAKTGLHQYADYEVYAQGAGVYRADFDSSRIGSGLSSAEAAKAAAQADYESRILSALAHPQPLPLKEEVERVLEPFARADQAIGDEPGPFHFETGTGYRLIEREDLRAARDLLSRLRAGVQEGDGSRGSSEYYAEKRAREWAVERWNAEVKNRPLVNVHRASLDTAWRQVIRHFGGDPEMLVGPDHYTLVEQTASPSVSEGGSRNGEDA